MIKRISCTANKNINGRPNGLADYREGVKERLTIYGGKGLKGFQNYRRCRIRVRSRGGGEGGEVAD